MHQDFIKSRGRNMIFIANLAVLCAALISFVVIRLAIAETATSTDQVAETIAEPAASTTIANIPAATPVADLREVRIIGTRYTDYFTDGTAFFTFPGDPEIHANIAKPNAPIPVRDGVTWDHSIGTWLYDTPSGDLEVGTYALQPNGSYIAYLATSTILNATSTPSLPARIVETHEHPVTGARVPPAGAGAGANDQSQKTTTAVAASTSSTALPMQTPQEAGQVLGTTTKQNQTLENNAVATTSSPTEQ